MSSMCRTFQFATGLSAALAGVAGVAATGQAAVMTFHDRAAYDLSAESLPGDHRLETFESETIRAITQADLMLESGLSIWSPTPNWLVDVTSQEAFSYNTTPGGSQHARFGFGGSSDFAAMFRLPGLGNGFGFDLTGFQDAGQLGGFAMDLLVGDTLVESLFIDSPGTFLDRFHGVVTDQAFDTVAIRILGGDFVGFDDITFVVMIPAHGSLAAMLLPFVCGGRRRRR